MSSYTKNSPVVEKRIEKVAKRMHSQFVGIMLSMNRAILKWCMPEISELEHFSKHRCWKSLSVTQNAIKQSSLTISMKPF